MFSVGIIKDNDSAEVEVMISKKQLDIETQSRMVWYFKLGK